MEMGNWYRCFLVSDETGTALEKIPEERGTYILISHLESMVRLDIGRMGRFDFVPGFYAYVGSAFGPGGLRGARAEIWLVPAADCGHVRSASAG